MSLTRWIDNGCLLLIWLASAASAQTTSQPVGQSGQAPIAKTNIIIERQLIRFTTPSEAVEWHLVVTNQQDEIVYDSGFVYGSALDWPLKNQQDEAVASGLYAYTLTTKATTDEAPHTQRGHLIVDRASSSDRVWLTSTQPVGIGADSATPQVTVSGSREATVGGAELPGGAPRREASDERGELPKRASDEAATGKTGLALSPNATANRVAKFGNDGVTPVDTQVSETNGAVVIGNAGATGNLQIFGQANADVFAGMGPDVANGPAFNFGYAGSSFGRSAGFFNVRPDASAVAPNPSLRFLTANQQRMIITNTGNVGIGTSAPAGPLHVHSNETFSPIYLSTGSGSEGPATFRLQADSGLSEQGRSFVIYDEDAHQYRMVINGSGNVGIGTPTPSSPSRVEIAAQDGLRISGYQPFMTLNDTNSGLRGAVASGDGNLGFYTHNSIGIAPAVIIRNDSGSVGIGISSPTAKLDVRTANYSTAVMGISSVPSGYGAIFDGNVGSAARGIWARSASEAACANCRAGVFDGSVDVTGTLRKSVNLFRIDHPQDPANKYLSHSVVEAPEYLNLYTGTATLDEAGEAMVKLPDYFEALNQNFRYQLTPIGAPGPNLYIAEKIANNHFKIAGGQAGLEVSWQVTGVRQDAYVKANPLKVEEEKPERERGHYLHPELYAQPEEKGVEWARRPELMRQMKEQRERAQPQKPQKDQP